MALTLSMYLEGDLDPRLLMFFEFLGARRVLAEIIVRYERELPASMLEELRRALAEVDVALNELELDLAPLLRDKRPTPHPR